MSEAIATREEMKVEAMERLKGLGVMKDVLNKFKKGVVYKSEAIGALFFLEDKEKEMVKNIEDRQGGLVYHVIHNYTNIGEMFSCLYVSQYKEDWEMEREMLKDGYVFSYVENVDMPDCSEFGDIVVKESFGGLRRVA